MHEIFSYDAYSDYIFADYYEKYTYYDQKYKAENDKNSLKTISLQEFRASNLVQKSPDAKKENFGD